VLNRLARIIRKGFLVLFCKKELLSSRIALLHPAATTG
jgi:hypothetical protein